MIPISAVIVTKNEARNIARCLSSLEAFSQVVVVDSGSTDETVALAHAAGAEVVSFTWNGAYPKKRQWCLENLSLRHEWVFFVDADEEATPEFLEALWRMDWSSVRHAGFFVKGAYVMEGRVLRFGLMNNKLCLLRRGRMEFPTVNDLDIPGMGEMEGHYQPVRCKGFEDAPVGCIGPFILHHALEDMEGWQARHERYARWEAAMDVRGAHPDEVTSVRRFMKNLFKAVPCRAELAFVHSYVLKLGFLEGLAGLHLARSRWAYYRMIRACKKR